ncbi:hypothetical protein SAMN05421824_1529 [Hyunsoonleella jejuensis]|uniref:Uncharacterized protein n=1 Tax=Hyunsoonleella jejuensis TaxID=419940 RepID=A0A1H9FPQ1_9FLAO|nr:hypothetical protein SAMN05421824_1529 [Hyunsoonleella jejuensis]
MLVVHFTITFLEKNERLILRLRYLKRYGFNDFS